jgi:hypothetical protein
MEPDDRPTRTGRGGVVSVPVPDPDMVRLLQALGVPQGDSLHDVLVAAETMRATLDAIDALHHKMPYGVFPGEPNADLCNACHADWPCPTVTILHPEDGGQ